jgi:hypothetical protein
MGWQEPLSTSELRELVESDISKLGYPDDKYPRVLFEENTAYSPDGVYVFSASQDCRHVYYHYVCLEERAEIVHKVTGKLYEIRFWALQYVAFELALRFEKGLGASSEYSRSLVLYKYFELLGNVDVDFKRFGEIIVDETLKFNPYEDWLTKED